MDFEKPGLGAQFSQLGYLLKHTFTIIGRDTDILSPIIRMSVYAAFVVVLFFAGIAAIIVGMGGTGTLLLLAMVIVFVYKFFYYNHQELRLSRLVYDTACGRDATVQGARKELADVKGRARILGLIDMANVWVVLKRGNGGLITRLILGALVEIWDLVNHFLLPVFAIDKLSFREGGERLHTLRDHVPETLVGVFGIDIMGNVVRTILGPLYLIAIILGIILGLASGGFMPTAFSAGSLGELFGSIPDGLPLDEQTLFNWLPLFVLIFLAFIGNAILARLVTAIKVIYFTLFYTRIAHADALDSDIRDELDGYLNLGNGDAFA
ncbi:MAG: hypothetical protein ACTJG4_11700 [Vreelandella alkaliphila]|uniref:Uncharacterized protein n=1 Tax=Halomonas campaniensis TaxID=213554 RepID=A0A3D0KJR7_9GAMM|nr:MULTISPECIES: hypothetical protein [unclassified Halomonas]HBP41448.1 hypothetical protein [Halomonas sp.]HBS83225.1 hypothetical protein [Halomonas campaniensis]HCA03753.1 hypothetical protein [Halomonas campaniensis]